MFSKSSMAFSITTKWRKLGFFCLSQQSKITSNFSRSKILIHFKINQEKMCMTYTCIESKVKIGSTF